MALPMILKNRLAVAALVLVFLIPLGLSSLRGLTHVLTCSEPVATPFTVNLDGAVPVVLSATQITAGDDQLLCGGLSIDVAATALEDRQIELAFAVANETDARWYGTVALDLEDDSMMRSIAVPISMGSVAPDSTERQTVVVRIPEGTFEFTGSLLIGP